MCIVISFQSQYTDGNGDFLSDAKDWAGELISGQTGTGRILVREKKTKYEVSFKCVVLDKSCFSLGDF